MTSLLTSCPSPAASCHYRIEADRNMQIEEYAGRVGLEDLREMASVVAADPERSGRHNRLVDLSNAELDLSSDDVLRFALLMRTEKHRSTGWHAFAVGSATVFSMVRMLSYWARVSERCRIFRSRDEAERWLEVNSAGSPALVPSMSVA